MTRFRPSKRRRFFRPTWSQLAVAAVPLALLAWSVWRWDRSRAWEGRLLAQSEPTEPASTPETPELPSAADNVPAPAGRAPEPKPASAEPVTVDSLLSAARTDIARGELVAARNHLTAALHSAREDAQLAAIRTELARIGEETVLSPRILPDDPLVERYVLQPGDTLTRIAKAHKISVEMLAELNGIADVNRIREGQTIKVIHGPFRAVVTKSTFSLDVYLGDIFVKSFPVGLGADDSTPTGQWRVLTKLKNPTYYPPRGGAIIAADDPANPLGERWIGLQGVSGEAEGQQRYGIHGTTEPDSIGKNVSMGCIRLRNEDVEALYNYLVEIHSTVAVSN